MGFTGFLGISTNLHAKLMALLHGLRMAWEYGVRNLLCNSNSLDVVRMVSPGVPTTHRYYKIVFSISRWFSKDWVISLEHTLRDGNGGIDFLAKLWARNDELYHTWVNPPIRMKLVLLADASNVQFLGE